MTISTRQLRYFEALARIGHFGRAAASVGISQPALSVQIRELEAVIGGPLVERGPGPQQLTELGREAAARAGSILSALRDLEEIGQGQRETLSGPLRLGVIPSVAPYLLPRLLPLLTERHPGLRLTLRETFTATLAGELAAGALDAVIASLPIAEGDFAEEIAFGDRFLLAVPAASPLVEAGPADLDQLAAEELLLLEEGHCLRDQALAACRKIDPARLRSFGAASLTTILQLVAAGQGVTLVPELAIASTGADPRLAFIRFREPQPGRMLGVAWRKTSPRERDFRALSALVAEGGRATIPA